MKNETKLPQIVAANELAAETSSFTSYLKHYGLPVDNIIATTEERALLASNLPAFFEMLSTDEKREARYLSKFVGAASVGLFDAALNYVWNEVVLNLRKKASLYGIDLFFDAAVGGNKRASYEDEDDLEGLKDSVLLDTCLKLELISDVVYRKLDHILTMRNEVAASHPNVEQIGSFELLGWLQTCVKDVLQDKPSESAIRINSLVKNVRERKTVVDEATRERFANELKNLSLPHVHNLLVTFFGIFVAPTTDQVLRKNVSLFAPYLWEHSEDRVKYRISALIDGYQTNLDEEREKQGHEFLTVVDGKEFESLPTKTIALHNLSTQLMEVHRGWDNFYNEPPVMREILARCKKSTDIPRELLPILVPVVLSCRLGRGLTYKKGVSPSGLPLYDQFLGLLDDDGIVSCIIALYDSRLNSKLSNSICQEHLGDILKILKTVAISERLKAAIDYLIAKLSKVDKAIRSKYFRELTKAHIKWS